MRLRAIAEQFFIGDPPASIENAIDQLEDVLRKVRNEVLEEAALAAQKVSKAPFSRASEAIRKLKHSEQNKGS